MYYLAEGQAEVVIMGTVDAASKQGRQVAVHMPLPARAACSCASRLPVLEARCLHAGSHHCGVVVFIYHSVFEARCMQGGFYYCGVSSC